MTYKITGALALATAAVLSLSAAVSASAHTPAKSSAKRAGDNSSVRATVLTPAPGETVSSGFNVDVLLQALNSRGNSALSGYRSAFVDPTGPDGQGNPAFHPGASANAPGLVVLLSTTPSMDGTPLQGPQTNLAGVFQINGVGRVNGRINSWNDWQVTSPGFFGKNTRATLRVYAVRGQAPDVVPVGGLRPVSNVVSRTFRIGS